MKQHLVERELTSEGPRRSGGVAPRRRSVTVNLAESPLGWLHARGHLDDRLFAAGERLRADCERAHLAPSVTMRWEPVRIRRTNHGALAPGERQIAARQRFDGAIAAAGKGLEDHSLARRLRVRDGDGGGTGARMACAQRQAGAQDRAGTGGRILPDRVR